MSAPETPDLKHELRAKYRATRKDTDHRHLLDERIRRHLLTQLPPRAGCTIGAYLAIDGEPDLEPALLALRDAGCVIALPVLGRGPEPSMQLQAWRAGYALRRNRFDIREPVGGPLVNLETIDCLLMPLVAYDAAGHRLGMGGGYYDRLLSGRTGQSRPLRVGVAYAAQQAGELPREPWDVPLNAVLNENGWFPFPL